MFDKGFLKAAVLGFSGQDIQAPYMFDATAKAVVFETAEGRIEVVSVVRSGNAIEVAFGRTTVGSIPEARAALVEMVSDGLRKLCVGHDCWASVAVRVEDQPSGIEGHWSTVRPRLVRGNAEQMFGNIPCL